MKISLFWFRRDLRIHDNNGLYHALNSPYPVLPLFIFDKNILKELPSRKDARVEFIHREIEKLHSGFAGHGSSLLVKHGKPEEVFKELLKEFDVAGVYTNHDYEPYALQRDMAVGKLLKTAGVSFHTFRDQVIFEKDEILNETGLPYKVFTSYKNKWKKLFQKDMVRFFSSDKKIEQCLKTKPYKIPSLKELGFAETGITFPPALLDTKIVRDYDKTRNFPAITGTTHLGLHLRFGTISVREAVKAGMKYNETWLDELIWREFFMQLLFHFPEVVQEPFNKKFKNLEWRYDEKDFQKWCEGKTGYPLVDAGMRELNVTGFMHNRVRMVCASFLTKHLLIDWKLGEKYFADKLLDFELSSNNGNWQWAAGTGADAQPFFRIFNPMTQQQKFDPDFVYIRKWVPEYGTSSYPSPMVDHKAAVERAKKAFARLSSSP